MITIQIVRANNACVQNYVICYDYGIPDDSSATEEARLSVSLSSLSLSSDNSPMVAMSSDISSSSESWDNSKYLYIQFTGRRNKNFSLITTVSAN